jgi:DDE superfamily endonuclease
MLPLFQMCFARCDLNQTKRIFNYRLSRACRIAENAFGILASCFRVFRTTIILGTAKAEKVVLSPTALHNFMRHHCSDRCASVASVDI